MNIGRVGDGNVVLIAGGGRVYTDVAARFTRTEKGLSEIIASPYNAALVRSIVDKGHLAATEFDWFVFGIEGYSRVTEAQLVRKRHASYLIKSGRVEHGGKGTYSIVYPKALQQGLPLEDFVANTTLTDGRSVTLSGQDLACITKQWYEQAVAAGYKEEDVRYWKPQATEFKAIIGMNTHALRDWFAIRCCRNAQREIRDLATKMLSLCVSAAPDLFAGAGPSCVNLGYCPENKRQNEMCKKIGRYLPKDEALEILKQHREF